MSFVDCIILTTDEWPFVDSGGIGVVVWDQAESYVELGFKVHVIHCGPREGSYALPPKKVAYFNFETRNKRLQLLKELIERFSNVLVHNHSESDLDLICFCSATDSIVVHSVHGYLPSFKKILKHYQCNDIRLKVPNWVETEVQAQNTTINNIPNNVIITTPSFSVLQEINQEIGPRHNLFVLMSAFNENRFPIAHKLCDQRRTLGYAGRISPDKGSFLLSDLVKYFDQNIDNVRWKIAGSFPNDKAIKSDLMKSWIGKNYANKIERYRFDEMPYFFQQIDILIVPSFYDPAPLVVLEALASGCIVILTPEGGAKECISGIKNGIVANDLSKNSFIDCILSILNNEIPLSSINEIERWKGENNWTTRLTNFLLLLENNSLLKREHI